MLSRFFQAQRTILPGGSISRFTLFKGITTAKCQFLMPRACLCVVSREDNNRKNNGRRNISDEERTRVARLYSIMIGSAVLFIGSSYFIFLRMTKVKAEAKAATIKEAHPFDKVDSNNEENVEVDARKKKRRSFKDRRIIEYENRIRQYSTPDKVFRYFATLKLPVTHHGDDSEVFMRPEDFVRSLTPGKIQPEGLGLDEFEKFDKDKHKYKGLSCEELGEDGSVFGRMGDYGLISFSDYIFLLTVLSLPPRMYEIAFQMFDLNGDGEVSPDEFDKVQSILFSLTATGGRHRDHSNTGSVVSYTVNSGLQVYFFGENGDKKLTGEEFIKFQRTLQKEVMYLEFQSYEPVNDQITERQFADMLLTYSSFHDKKKEMILKRVRKAFKENSQGVTFKQYLNFFHFLRNIGEADVALSFHNAANKAIDPETFKRVASTIAGVILDDHIVDIVYKMFDENDDGELSHKEFISVMKNQLVRGLENPKDTGFTKLLSGIWNCSKHKINSALHPRETELIC